MATKPNIIVFFTDQQRWDSCSCYGNPMVLTPHLDAMATEGTRFEFSFTVQPLCGPARSCFQTGKYATNTGVWRNAIPLRDDEQTLAHWFGAAGYRTGYIGKWHLSENHREIENPADRLAPVPKSARGGYHDWYAANVLEFFSHPYEFRVQDNEDRTIEKGGYRVDAQTDLALEYLRERARDPQPFFLFLSYLEPHHQNDMNRYVGPEGSQARFREHYVPADLVGHKGDWVQELPDYYGCVASLDDNLGRLRAELKNLNLDRNTILLFCSDHGCHFRTRNAEYKRSCHESSIRVPTVFCGPGFEGGKVIRELVDLLDWPATLLDAAGIPLPLAMQGDSLLPLVHGERDAIEHWKQEILVQISENHIGRALRTKRWKYAVSAPAEYLDGQGGSSLYVEAFLYDLNADPNEQFNLLTESQYKDVRLQLRERLIEHMVRIGERKTEIIDFDRFQSQQVQQQ